MNMQTQTPRADAKWHSGHFVSETMAADFARTLERELAEKDAQIVALRDVCNVAYNTPRGEALSDHALECLEQALSAPPPPVVPLEYAMWLYEALEAKESFGHPSNCIVAFKRLHPEVFTATPTTEEIRQAEFEAWYRTHSLSIDCNKQSAQLIWQAAQASKR